MFWVYLGVRPKVSGCRVLGVVAVGAKGNSEYKRQNGPT